MMYHRCCLTKDVSVYGVERVCVWFEWVSSRIIFVVVFVMVYLVLL